MNRSRPAGDGGDQVHPRRRPRQGLHGARPVLQAAAVDRQVPGRPDDARREVHAQRSRRRRTSRPTTSSTCRRSITTCGSARRRSGRSTAIASTTTGTGTGTTATATAATRARTSSTSRAGACRSRSTRSRSESSGGYFGDESSQETPNMQTTMFEYADGTILEFAHARRLHQRRGHVSDRQPVLRHEGLALDRGRRPQVAVVLRTEEREGPGRRPARQRRRQRPTVT